MSLDTNLIGVFQLNYKIITRAIERWLLPLSFIRGFCIPIREIIYLAAIKLWYPRGELNSRRRIKSPLLKSTQLRGHELFESCHLNASQAQIVCCFFEKLWIVKYGYLYVAFMTQ